MAMNSEQFIDVFKTLKRVVLFWF